MLIFLSIISWLFVFIFLIVLVLFCVWTWTIFTAKVPFIPIPNSILGDIDKVFDITNTSVVYDLGCGDGRVLSYLSKKHPKAKYIGMENSLFPIILAHFRNWWDKKSGHAGIEILNQDFFNHDLSDATHVFTYLYPNVMDDLLPKFDRELKSGTKLVSVSFKFTSKQPIAEIDLDRPGYKLARKLYIYQF